MIDPGAKSLVTYAQNREDVILRAFFYDTDKGFYVDVGANHPTSDSVTKMFYDMGWRGINIEPIKELHKKFRKDRPEDINLAVGVSNEFGELEFTEFETHGISTFSADTAKEYAKDEKVKKSYTVKVDTLASILEGQEFDSIQFLKIDIEGYEYEALEGNDWDKYRPEVICIEANHVERDWRPILTDNGYSLAYFDGLNEYYVEEKSKHRAELFRESFPKILVDAPIIEMPWQKVIDRLTEQLENVQAALDSQTEVSQRLEKELHIHQGEIANLKQTHAQELEEANKGFMDKFRNK